MAMRMRVQTEAEGKRCLKAGGRFKTAGSKWASCEKRRRERGGRSGEETENRPNAKKRESVYGAEMKAKRIRKEALQGRGTEG